VLPAGGETGNLRAGVGTSSGLGRARGRDAGAPGSAGTAGAGIRDPRLCAGGAALCAASDAGPAEAAAGSRGAGAADDDSASAACSRRAPAGGGAGGDAERAAAVGGALQLPASVYIWREWTTLDI